MDLIQPKAKGGSDHEDNLQGICETCHRRKTSKEQLA
ncbi:HNH endonuclease [Hahella aquimaris]